MDSIAILIFVVIHELLQAATSGGPALPPPPHAPPLPEDRQYSPPNPVPFSEYFREKDQQEIWAYEDRKVQNKKYRSLIDLWKRPLEKKRLRQARIK